MEEIYEKTRKVGYYHNGKKEFPKILLQGEYLREAGFEIGDMYKVRVSYGKVEVEKVYKCQKDNLFF